MLPGSFASEVHFRENSSRAKQASPSGAAVANFALENHNSFPTDSCTVVKNVRQSQGMDWLEVPCGSPGPRRKIKTMEVVFQLSLSLGKPKTESYDV